MGSGLNDHTYLKRAAALKRRAKANNTPCWLCGKPINWNAEWKAPDSFTADHVQPRSKGGALLGELRPAH